MRHRYISKKECEDLIESFLAEARCVRASVPPAGPRLRGPAGSEHADNAHGALPAHATAGTSESFCLCLEFCDTPSGSSRIQRS